MCGRARASLAPATVANVLGLSPEELHWRHNEAHAPSYNLAPGAKLTVIRQAGTGNSIELETMTWGLVPSFHKGGTPMDHWRMFNARSETLHTSPVFKRLLASKRCVVLLNGFYEWKLEGKQKQPYYVYLKQQHQQAGDTRLPASEKGSGLTPGERLMPIAGLWDVAHGDDGTLVPTVTLLTCDSSKPLAWLHDRMPVILGTPEQLEAWLGVPLPPGHDAHTLFGAAAHHPGSPAAQEVHTPKASSKGMEQEDVKQEEGQESEEGIKAGSPGRAVKKEEQSGRDVSPKAAGQLEQDVATAEKGEEDQKPSHEYAAAGSGHGKGMGEEEEEHSATPGSSAKPAGGGDWSTFVAKVARPYSGPDLAWHPVATDMTKLSHQGPDCCKDVRTKKGTISAFFAPKQKQEAKQGQATPPSKGGGIASSPAADKAAPATNADDCDATGGAAEGQGGEGHLGHKRKSVSPQPSKAAKAMREGS